MNALTSNSCFGGLSLHLLVQSFFYLHFEPLVFSIFIHVQPLLPKMGVAGYKGDALMPWYFLVLIAHLVDPTLMGGQRLTLDCVMK